MTAAPFLFPRSPFLVGYGAKLTNIFSTKFLLETADSKPLGERFWVAREVVFWNFWRFWWCSVF